jgi:hypothetical protein
VYFVPGLKMSPFLPYVTAVTLHLIYATFVVLIDNIYTTLFVPLRYTTMFSAIIAYLLIKGAIEGLSATIGVEAAGGLLH